MSFPILNAPQVGILSTDGVTTQVVVDDSGGLRMVPMGNLCLTFDHRAVDGAYAGAFLARVGEIVAGRDWAAEV
jgi:2-oxoglutarate dehydrogenase E2 component (dihydrolipoamide succinyltransferase)